MITETDLRNVGADCGHDPRDLVTNGRGDVHILEVEPMTIAYFLDEYGRS